MVEFSCSHNNAERELISLAQMPDILHLDFETYSQLDLRKVGAYKYAEHPSTEILVAGYAFNDGPVKQWQPHLRKIPPVDLTRALDSDNVLILAHNAEFERRIIIHKMGCNLPRARYRCTAARAAAAGLPRALDGALAALGSPIRKDPRGRNALRHFSQPRKPTKNDARTRKFPVDDPERWQIVLEYNEQDIHSERELDNCLPDLQPREWRYFHYIAKVNDRGLPLDVAALEGASKAVAKLEKQTQERVRKITGGINPTQVAKVRDWLAEHGLDLPNLQLKTLNLALRDQKMSNACREIVTARIEASRASTKKIKAMLDVLCKDQRAHGTLLFYGAHTGRLSGKLIQPHNFTRGLLDNKESNGAVQAYVLDLFTDSDVDFINTILWHQPDDTPTGTPPLQGPMSMLAQSMRGFIRAPKGMWFLVVDYAAIEARILAWVANEVKLLIAFRNKVDTYKMMASVLYKVPVEEVTSEQRRIGKNLRLGAGYQLGAKRLIEHCEKEEIFIDLQFAKQAIQAFRDDSRNTVRLWYGMEEAAIRAMQNRRQVQGAEGKSVYFEPWKDWLLMHLPSGRRVHYYQPEVTQVVKFGKPKLQLSYLSYEKGKLRRESTYGGKLVENMVQAIARDIMMEGMLAAEEGGYPALASIHDEIVTLRKQGEGSLKELEQLVCRMPSWAKGIPLAAEGFTCERYRKG